MCEQENEDFGIVYALTNEAMPGLVKIGMSSNSDGGPIVLEMFEQCCFLSLIV